MNRRNAFTTHEVEIIRKHWPTMMPLEELLALLPRHTKSSVTQQANVKMCLRRPKAQPAWSRFRAILGHNAMSQDEIAAVMGVTRRRVYQFIVKHRAEVYIKSWRWSEDHLGLAALWALGSAPDAPRPVGYRRWMDGNRGRRTNPFLAAAGMIEAPKGAQTGRVYKQSMSIAEDEAA